MQNAKLQSSERLSEAQSKELSRLEPALRRAVLWADLAEAERITAEIVTLLMPTGHKTRIQQNKNWLFACALEAGKLEYAISGFSGVRQLVADNTRAHLEATALIGLCFLRKGKTEEAKSHLKEAFSSINRIRSDRRRHQFHARFIERIEQECILVGLGHLPKGKLDIDDVHETAIALLQKKNSEEIEEDIGALLPGESILLLRNVRDFSILQLPPPDRKLLMPSKEATSPKNIGKKATAAFKNVAWRSLCSPKSEVYKMWSSSLEAACNGKLVTGSVVAALSGWNVGVVALAASVSASAMKFSAEVFCRTFAPESLMIHISEKD